MVICVEKRCIALELCEAGNLYSLIHNNKTSRRKVQKSFLDAKLKESILLGIAQGMNFIHSKDIIHGDLSSLNVLLTEEYKVKIADFVRVFVFLLC
jgi:serine/threonine protein kinase